MADATNDAPVVELYVSGGLGNQMFEYAAGRVLCLDTGARLRLDLGFYGRKRHRAFELSALPIVAEFEEPGRKGLLSGLFRRKLPVYREPHFQPDPAFASLRPPIRLEGYFQSPAYFARHAATIRAELMPPEPTDTESQAVAAAMAAGPSAALHIRRGDYVSNPKASAMFATCPLTYYEAGLGALPDAMTVFVFSDDIAWARQHLKPIRPLVFVSEKADRTGLADLWLMTRAHHHIIANSSFSWWGAWLAGEDKGTTIAPSRWFNDPAIDDSGLIPAGWIRLPS